MEGIDPSDPAWAPVTYWPESRTPEQLLSRIKGQARRELAREVLASEGFQGLTTFLARDELPEIERQEWGALHPALMGGEYLPPMLPGEVEIARISLRSTTGDQVSIRARPGDGKIGYRVVDEHDTEFELPFTGNDHPLALGELVTFIDGSSDPDREFDGGLPLSHWNYMYEGCGEDPESSVAFASIESGYYPGLADYYRGVAGDWIGDKSPDGVMRA